MASSALTSRALGGARTGRPGPPPTTTATATARRWASWAGLVASRLDAHRPHRHRQALGELAGLDAPEGGAGLDVIDAPALGEAAPITRRARI
jgi:hypothetical protein